MRVFHVVTVTGADGHVKHVLQGYGPTLLVGPYLDTPAWPGFVKMGRPINAMRAFIVDVYPTDIVSMATAVLE